jgi:acetyltransferase-like isoleucine patch superfamily enzyme
MFLEQSKLEALGFAQLGDNVRISTRASIYSPGSISIGSNSRVDDFVVLSAGSAGISIGRNVHMAVFSTIQGAGRVVVADFANVSSRVAVYSSNDDYSGEFLTNPTIPPEFTNVSVGDVSIGRHVIIGSGSVVLPGVTIEEGAAIGALSLVTADCDSFGTYAGVPARRIGDRRRELLDVEEQYLRHDRDL